MHVLEIVYPTLLIQVLVVERDNPFGDLFCANAYRRDVYAIFVR